MIWCTLLLHHGLIKNTWMNKHIYRCCTLMRMNEWIHFHIFHLDKFDTLFFLKGSTPHSVQWEWMIVCFSLCLWCVISATQVPGVQILCSGKMLSFVTSTRSMSLFLPECVLCGRMTVAQCWVLCALYVMTNPAISLKSRHRLSTQTRLPFV